MRTEQRYLIIFPIVLVVIGLMLCEDVSGVAGLVWHYVHKRMVVPLHDLVWYVLFTPACLSAIALTFALERFIPANPRQKIVGPGLSQDFVWFFYERIFHLLVFITYVDWLKRVYAEHWDFLTIQAIGTWPAPVRFVLGVLLLDLLYWVQHYLNHKVPWLWRFHVLHHSQRELNFFTDYRYHVVEYLVRHTIIAIPFLFLDFETPTVVAFAYFQRWYTRFYHGNIKTSLGWFKYILVTPQSHRIHHSIEPQHHDKNYGALFSIWDFAFGTQYRHFDQYPDTGVAGERFPYENTTRFPMLLFAPAIQTLHSISSLRGRLDRSKTP